MDRRSRVLLAGSLVCVPLLIAASAAAAQTELASGAHADSDVWSVPASEPNAVIQQQVRGKQQPELLVASLIEPQSSLYPAPGQAPAILPDRRNLKTSKKDLVVTTTDPIVSYTAATRPAYCANSPRFAHTATADPYVDAHV